jgi:hypothetical protein
MIVYLGHFLIAKVAKLLGVPEKMMFVLILTEKVFGFGRFFSPTHLVTLVTNSKLVFFLWRTTELVKSRSKPKK